MTLDAGRRGRAGRQMLDGGEMIMPNRNHDVVQRRRLLDQVDPWSVHLVPTQETGPSPPWIGGVRPCHRSCAVTMIVGNRLPSRQPLRSNLMFGKNQAESRKDSLSTASGIVSVLAARLHRQPLTNAEISAKQEWLQGVVRAWTVGRSI
jgi:hypothetical protein